MFYRVLNTRMQFEPENICKCIATFEFGKVSSKIEKLSASGKQTKWTEAVTLKKADKKLSKTETGGGESGLAKCVVSNIQYFLLYLLFCFNYFTF